MDWCDENRVGYIFGLAGNAALDRKVAEISEYLRWHAWSAKPELRCDTCPRSPDETLVLQVLESRLATRIRAQFLTTSAGQGLRQLSRLTLVTFW